MRMSATVRRHAAEVGLAAAVVLMVAMMIVPLPTWVLDVLIATNLAIAVLLLLVAFLVRNALGFGAFPTILLVTTLYRLALNVSSTRLILLDADAGEVIEAFGTFVVSGNYIVGAIVFAILTIIQLIVIARGSERVAEVGARFTLDAMPGKQLAIDADLRAGVLDADRAAARRRTLERESQFYGAMDGAMKFVKGDAIAALVIIVVNIVGGLAVGVLVHGMDALTALRVYGLLTIGDGLVSQIPALLISTAAGLVVTRVASEDESGTLGSDIGAQIFGDWRALAVASAFCALLAIVPGLPLVPFAVLAAILGASGYALSRRRPSTTIVTSDEEASVGPFSLIVGAGLARALATDARFADELRVVGSTLYDELGVRLPAVRPEPSPRLDRNGYELRLGGVAVDRGRCPSDRRFVRGDADELRARDPDVELDGDGGWVRALEEGTAASELLVQRIHEAVRAHPAALLGIQETQRELDRIARDAPALVRAVVPERISLARLAALLRALVVEGVSVRPLREILEALALDPLPSEEHAMLQKVRERLARQLTHGLLREDGVLGIYALDPMLEDGIRDGIRGSGSVAVDPELARELVQAVRDAVDHPRTVLLTQPDVRHPLWQLLAPELPHVSVLSYRELDPSVQVERLGVITPP